MQRHDQNLDSDAPVSKCSFVILHVLTPGLSSNPATVAYGVWDRGFQCPFAMASLVW